MGRKGEVLSLKEREFCRQFIVLRNAEQAAVAAGYSRKTAAKKAAGWVTGKLGKVGVKKEIERLESLRDRKALMTADEVERYLDMLIRANLKDYYDEHGQMKNIKDLTREQAYALKSITSFTREGEGGTAGILGQTCERYDPLHAIKLKMQRLGMLKTTLELGKSFEDVMREIHGLPPVASTEPNKSYELELP